MKKNAKVGGIKKLRLVKETIRGGEPLHTGGVTSVGYSECDGSCAACQTRQNTCQTTCGFANTLCMCGPGGSIPI